MFVIALKYLKPLAEIDQHLQAHRDFLKTGYQQNLLLASGPQNPRTGGIIIARGNNRQQVLDFIANDPFQKLGLAEYQLTEFDAVLTAEGIQK